MIRTITPQAARLLATRDALRAMEQSDYDGMSYECAEGFDDHLCLLKTPSTAQSLTFPRSGSSSPTPMLPLLYAICATARSSLRPRRELALQNLARRRRVGVAKAVTKKPRASPRGGIESDVTSFWETSAPPVLRQGRGGKRGPGSFSVRGRVCADRFWKRPTGTSGLLALRQHLT